jgi:hypothetical protein
VGVPASAGSRGFRWASKNEMMRRRASFAEDSWYPMFTILIARDITSWWSLRNAWPAPGYCLMSCSTALAVSARSACGAAERPVLGSVAADDRAGAGEEGLDVLRDHAVVDAGGLKAVAGGEQQREPATHAEPDHADLPGAVLPTGQPGADGLDVLIGPSLSCAKVADDCARS